MRYLCQACFNKVVTIQSIGCNFIKNNVLLEIYRLTFNSKGGLYSVKDNLYIRMPMPIPMPMPMPMPTPMATCRCRDFQMALLDAEFTGRFISSSYEKYKKLSLHHKYKYIKNTMTTGITQKSYQALFPLCSLKKKDILKLIKQKIRRRNFSKKYFLIIMLKRIDASSIFKVVRKIIPSTRSYIR